MNNLFRRLIREDAGQDIIEYALMAAGIAVLMIPTIQLGLGPALQAVYQRITGQVSALP